jgi:hypothetical protein
MEGQHTPPTMLQGLLDGMALALGNLKQVNGHYDTVEE